MERLGSQQSYRDNLFGARCAGICPDTFEAIVGSYSLFEAGGHLRSLVVAMLMGHSMGACGQTHPGVDSVFHPGRFWGVTVGGGAVMAGSLVALDQVWFSDYERTHFRFFNDGREWLGMDKAGHFYTSYWIGRWSNGLLGWSGVRRKDAAWAGFATSMAFLTGVELLDAHSAGWGFSGWDMLANVSGAGLFLGQELAWGEQKVKLKFSVRPSPYAAQRPELLGRGFVQELIKDYNAQTIWATIPLGAATRRSDAWGALGISLGHAADGMLTGHPSAGDGRVRQLLLSLDLDLECIPTRSKAVRTALFLLNCLKIPAPALEWRSDGRFVAHGLYY